MEDRTQNKTENINKKGLKATTPWGPLCAYFISASGEPQRVTTLRGFFSFLLAAVIFWEENMIKTCVDEENEKQKTREKRLKVSVCIVCMSL